MQHYRNTKRNNLLGLLSAGMGKIQGTWIIAMPVADCTQEVASYLPIIHN